MPARLDHLRIKQLHFIELLASLGSLAATADRLSMSPSAASMMLKEIEGIFGVKLFERQGRGMSLTSAGQAMLPRCQSVLGEIGGIRESLADRVAPLLRIGAFPHTTTTVLPQLVQALITAPAPWRIKLSSESAENLLQHLLAGEIDLMLGQLPRSAAGHPGIEQLAQRVLYQGHLCIVGAQTHPLAQRRGLRLEDLLEWPWVLPGMQSTTRVALVDAFLRRGLPPPTPVVESPSFFYSLSLVAQTQLLTCCAHSAAALSGHLTAILPVQMGHAPTPIAMIWRKACVQAAKAAQDLRELSVDVPSARIDSQTKTR